MDNKYCMECFNVDDLSEIVFLSGNVKIINTKVVKVVTLWPSFIFV